MKHKRKILWAGIVMLFAVFQSFPVLAAFEQEQTGMIQMTLPEDWKKYEKEKQLHTDGKIS